MPLKLKHSQIAPTRLSLLKEQGNICPLCVKKKDKWALDHDHKTGFIRGVLCINCNGMEGKIFNLARRCVGHEGVKAFLQRLIDYYTLHEQPQHGGLIHPTHKTEQEKRLAANARARAKRAKLKG